jgi:hypothetical protein
MGPNPKNFISKILLGDRAFMGDLSISQAPLTPFPWMSPLRVVVGL